MPNLRIRSVLIHYASNVGTPGELVERICSGNADQVCPYCSSPLRCIDDYVGGGSHYWWLTCGPCYRDFVYDTYRFVLEDF